MRVSSSRGQALVFFVLVLPVLMLLAGITIRSGKTLLVHQRIENHCNKKILDALAEEGKGLQRLGKLNPFARSTIDSRRKIDKLLESGAAPPPLIPELIAAQLALQIIQIKIAAEQKLITMNALESTLAIIKRPPPQEERSKIKEEFKPQEILAPHQMKSVLTLHVTKEPSYKFEIGAPLEPDGDFDQRQEIHGLIEVETEKFLSFWSPLPRAENILIACMGKVQMTQLEDKWSAHLIQKVVKPSLKLFSE